MTYSTIELASEDEVAILTFNRPKVLNAFDTALVREVGDAMNALSADNRAEGDRRARFRSRVFRWV